MVEKKIPSSKDQDASTYEEFIGQLKPNEPRYAIYDLNYTLDDGGERSKLVFIAFIPDGAPIKQKMLYASSKADLKKKLNGIHVEIQATDFDEVDYETVHGKASGGGTK